MKTLKTILLTCCTLITLGACEKEEFLLINEKETTMNIISSDNNNSITLEVDQEPTDKIDLEEADDCKKVDVCDKNGKLKNMPLEGVYSQIKNGGMLFSCNDDDGLNQEEILTVIYPYLIAAGGDVNSFNDQKSAFQTWYVETYCGSGTSGGSEDEGGTFNEGAGSDL